MICLNLKSRPKNKKRVISEVYHYKYMCVCRFELTDDDTYLVNLKGNYQYRDTCIFSYNFNDLAVH